MNTILESEIAQLKELNYGLVKEREAIHKKVLLMKFNNDNLITDVSEALLNLLGYAKDELLEHDIFEYERLHIVSDLKKEILQHIANKQVFKFEQKTLNKEGKELWMLNTLVPEYNKYGTHIGFILFKDDITLSKILYKNQDQLIINVRASAMTEMVSMLAHQWRQPLSVLTTTMAIVKVKHELKLLNEDLLLKSFDKMENIIQNLSTMIDNFRNYIKPDEIVEKVMLSRVFEQSKKLLNEELKHLDVEYIQEIDKSIIIQTHSNELMQSIVNVLKNSLDAFSKNDYNHKRKIIVEAQTKDTHIIIHMTDNAGGIEPEILRKIYEPYFSTKYETGTGLGLYMSKIIIEKHLKGKITLSSKDNKTDVIIELPYSMELKSNLNN